MNNRFIKLMTKGAQGGSQGHVVT